VFAETHKRRMEEKVFFEEIAERIDLHYKEI